MSRKKRNDGSWALTNSVARQPGGSDGAGLPLIEKIRVFVPLYPAGTLLRDLRIYYVGGDAELITLQSAANGVWYCVSTDGRAVDHVEFGTPGGGDNVAAGSVQLWYKESL